MSGHEGNKWSFGRSGREAALRHCICTSAIGYSIASLLVQPTLVFSAIGLLLLYRAVLRCSPSGYVLEKRREWLCKTEQAEEARVCTLESMSMFRRVLVIRVRFLADSPKCLRWLVFADALEDEQWRALRRELFLRQSAADTGPVSR